MKASNQNNPTPRLSQFLRKVNAEGIKKYEKIDELFVPPVEYDSIKFKEINTILILIFWGGGQSIDV
jgi:hypothetical protein